MKVSDNLKKQHVELLDIANEIISFSEKEVLEKNASQVSKLLARFSGKLKVHLAMEDQALYPMMLKSSDQNIVETTKSYMEEMEGLTQTYGEYSKKWNSQSAIEKGAEEFIEETKNIIEVLGNRIDKEENILFPLADRVI